MLTKDLIRARLAGGRLRPGFIAVDDSALLTLAESLLRLYGSEPAPTRAELATAVQPLVAGARDLRLVRGLEKICLDRSEFAQVSDCDYPACRHVVFQASAARLAAGNLEDVEAYRRDVLAASNLPEAFRLDDVYADLPENEPLARFRSLTPRQLLERYNVALVQALLLRSQAIEVTVSSPDPAKMRRLFKYLRFFRLLARLHGTVATAVPEQGDTVVHLTIEGPGSVLAQPKRYGLQLASFFPAICALDAWELDAMVEWKGTLRRLRLSEQSGLVSHYRTFSAYVPEEIRLFHRHFADTVEEWSIVGQTPFLRVGEAEVIFPDLSFQHRDGMVIHLELFHRWHAGPLLERLRALEAHPEPPLIIGVDRALTSDPATAEACEQSGWFAERGFLFKDYPTVNRALDCLQRAAAAVDGGLP